MVCRVILLAILLWVSGPADAVDVSMAFGDKIPPYSFPETNSGIELEIIGESLAYKGHRLLPRFFPLARVPRAFMLKQVDAAMTDMGNDMTAEGGYYGNPAVIYDNVFISLKSRGLKIEQPEDLEGLRVISFQGADKRYPNWLEGTVRAGNFQMTSQQDLQVLTLFAGRYDLVLADKSIFKYFALRLQAEKGIDNKPVDEHEVFELRSSDYRPIFRDAKVRDDFNLGLQYLKDTGRYQAIYDHYLKD